MRKWIEAKLSFYTKIYSGFAFKSEDLISEDIGQSQQQVRVAIEEVLHENLPDTYDRVEFKKTCERAYDLVYEYSSRGHKWAA